MAKVFRRVQRTQRMEKGVPHAIRHAPPPDVYDPQKHVRIVAAGNNKFGWTRCPTCIKPPTELKDNVIPKAFLFVDDLSAREYQISGMCQACQDATFNCTEE